MSAPFASVSGQTGSLANWMELALAIIERDQFLATRALSADELVYGQKAVLGLVPWPDYFFTDTTDTTTAAYQYSYLSSLAGFGPLNYFNRLVSYPFRWSNWLFNDHDMALETDGRNTTMRATYDDDLRPVWEARRSGVVVDGAPMLWPDIRTDADVVAATADEPVISYGELTAGQIVGPWTIESLQRFIGYPRKKFLEIGAEWTTGITGDGLPGFNLGGFPRRIVLHENGVLTHDSGYFTDQISVYSAPNGNDTRRMLVEYQFTNAYPSA